ncbi:MAG: hypothetical protein DCC75_07955 [Proteobacteria bacterium]|nr:MAG: hypothetical protein DCC75_07955 [Pseudomonadota bacterium]
MAGSTKWHKKAFLLGMLFADICSGYVPVVKDMKAGWFKSLLFLFIAIAAFEHGFTPKAWAGKEILINSANSAEIIRIDGSKYSCYLALRAPKTGKVVRRR